MILDLTNNKMIARNVKRAESFSDRLQGMIGRDFRDFDAMIFYNCNSIHMFFMKMPLDVIFLDRENKVRKTAENLRPWVPCCGCRNACTVIELPAGTLKKTDCREGDILDVGTENCGIGKFKFTDKRILMEPQTGTAENHKQD